MSIAMTRPIGVGASVLRRDAWPKTNGAFEFTSDLWHEGELHAAFKRALVPRARVVRIDVSEAAAMPGVQAAVTAADVPGNPLFGIHHPDQPVFASDEVRYYGEVLAVVAAVDAETARRAVDAIIVELEPLPPLLDAGRAVEAHPIHPDGNVIRRIHLRHGELEDSHPDAVTVEGAYEVGMQDQAFLGVESGLAAPTPDGGVQLIVGSQDLHADRRQIAACLGVREDLVHLVLGGVGGAFGGKEDLNIHVPLAILALQTGRPVKVCFDREESFLSHVHRHPGRMWYRHTAAPDGRLLKVEANIVLDGGAYASTSAAVIANAVCFSVGPYRVNAADIEGTVVRTNNPPAGAMRGFGAVQVCIAHEAQMDKLAGELGIDPVELRLRNALRTGDRIITGQVIQGTAPVEELIRSCAATPLPDGRREGLFAFPGAAGRTADAARVRRGVGLAVGFKNLMFAEGHDDFSTARCALEDGVVRIACAAVEFGQGFVTVAEQIAREVFGTEVDVVVEQPTTKIGTAGSTSASRQSWMSGGAVLSACEAVRKRVLTEVAARRGLPLSILSLSDGRIVCDDGESIGLADLGPIAETREYHHKLTTPLDERGQGDAHVSFAFVAHRAVVDVDLELGLVKVVEMATSQDCGRVLNPIQVVGQIEGGIAQGVGLAVMEEIIVTDGVVMNPSFTDYLIPTIVDMPTVTIAALIEDPEPGAPFGAKGVGESPTVSSTAAVLAAIRDATGRPVTQAPVRPQDLLG